MKNWALQGTKRVATHVWLWTRYIIMANTHIMSDAQFQCQNQRETLIDGVSMSYESSNEEAANQFS